MQDKAPCLSKWLSDTRRAYPPHIRLTTLRSRRGAEEARSGAKALMQDKAPCLSKWVFDPERAYSVHIRRRSLMKAF